ncbi:unnamed protein product [Ranitomeya imitator]|uniref:Cell division cycle protein 27 homolog n=1 Tax=Ranitomeya imitator TaxID=111125 RepID=A0ABN9KX53_9NEOB|nr:unnamed protein product [Ranitomeya imitator]
MRYATFAPKSRFNDAKKRHFSANEGLVCCRKLFRLQREHDIAIKVFPASNSSGSGYAYAFTLLGHEFVLTEELDKALACFRNAIRVNPRHYNAWYGLGMIYYSKRSLGLAEMHFQKGKALDIKLHKVQSRWLSHIGWCIRSLVKHT